MEIKNSYLSKMYEMLFHVYKSEWLTITSADSMVHDSLRLITKHSMEDIERMDLNFIDGNVFTQQHDNLVPFFVRYMMSLDDKILIDNRWQEFDHKDDLIVKYSNDAYELIKNNKMTDEYMTEFMTILKLMY